MNKNNLFFHKLILITSLCSWLISFLPALALGNINELKSSFNLLANASNNNFNLIKLEKNSLKEDNSKNSNTEENSDDSDFSDTGGGSVTSASGGSRNDCPKVDIPLTALIPNNSNFHKTTEAKPTFWFYVPYSPQEIPIGDFVLQNRERDDIFRKDFTLPETPGFVSFTIPENEDSLNLGEEYIWYFRLFCDSEKESTPDYVQGYVTRVAVDDSINNNIDINTPLDDMIQLARKDWYTVVNNLINLRSNNLTNEVFNEILINFWQTTLKRKESDEFYFITDNIELLSQQRVIDSVNLVDNEGL